jgi:hypothetical protein
MEARGAPVYAVEEDLETAAGRSSEEQSETDVLLEMKTPFVSVAEVEASPASRCRSCRRSRTWRGYFMETFHLRRAGICCNGKAVDLDIHERKPTSRRMRNCRIVSAFFITCLAILYV